MMAHKRMTNEQILKLEQRAREHVNSVNYAVSLRWVFYRLLQDGIYHEKEDWSRWKLQASKFRHNGTWPPDFLEDGTREVTYRGLSRSWSEEEILEDLVDEDSLAIYFLDSHFTRQDYYVELWFEARAMIGQFEKYTEKITLRPFGGDYTIGPKYQAAKDLEECAERFNKPIKVLYFGDCDKKGNKIFKAATTGPKGCQKWCSIPVEYIFCGLTIEQVEDFRARGEEIPENPDKPSEYQWEALTDSQAREIISHGVQQHLDLSKILEMEEEELEKAMDLSKRIYRVLKHMEDKE